jgi:hypothetical protein
MNYLLIILKPTHKNMSAYFVKAFSSYLTETKLKMTAIATILAAPLGIERNLPQVEANPHKKIQVDPSYRSQVN